MPIYEYRCASCAERFEQLVRSADAAVACPTCGGADVDRLLSTFSRVGSSAAAPRVDYSRLGQHRRAGGCCGGGCRH